MNLQVFTLKVVIINNFEFKTNHLVMYYTGFSREDLLVDHEKYYNGVNNGRPTVMPEEGYLPFPPLATNHDIC